MTWLGRLRAALGVTVLWFGVGSAGAVGAPPNVLLVAPVAPPGGFTSIQAAVDAAAPGDWVLVAPGVYHEQGPGGDGVRISKANIHLRGMDRNRVIIDGTQVAINSPTTLPDGSPHCPAAAVLQDFGPIVAGKAAGRNGIQVRGGDKTTGAKFQADGVYIENLTVCNFLSDDSGTNGNEIWWNGGDGTGQIGMHSLWGSYLSATSTYYKSDGSAQAKYGIFTSNEDGPGTIDNTYASNMGDSNYYIGACPDCNLVLSHAHAQYGALGYSGTNGSGHVQILNGEWDNNKAGIAPNTLNNDDAPSPQTGFCASPPAGQPGCFIVKGNSVHDNNNPNVPQAGIAAAAPVGTGIILSGTQRDFVTGNRVVNNIAWGILANDYPDTSSPPPVANCAGGTSLPTGACYFVSKNNLISGNSYANNGTAHPMTGNADEANVSTADPTNGNCFKNNTDDSGTVTADPPTLEAACPGTSAPLSTVQLLCNSGAVVPCVQGFSPTGYPTKDGVCTAPAVFQGDTPTTGACMLPLVAQPTMPDPCAGAPANAFCPAVAVPDGRPALLLIVGLASLLILALGRRPRAARLHLASAFRPLPHRRPRAG